jgi:shikimate dehydrogenase
MQNAGIAALGLNWRYLAFEVHPDDLRAAITGAQGRDQGGTWRPLREFVDPPRELRSHGFNTDADAIVRSLQEDLGLKLTGASVLQLGVGGAGRTAALKLASAGAAELFLVNRTQSKAEEVAREIRERHPGTRVVMGYPSKPVDLLLNATSLGLKPGDASPLDETQFRIHRAGAVYDMIYRPAETRLLALAKGAGCRAANGLGMLLYQGARALELWSDQPAPITHMRQALADNVYGNR